MHSYPNPEIIVNAGVLFFLLEYGPGSFVTFILELEIRGAKL